MTTPTQNTLFPDKEQINAIKAESFIWHYFFDQHGLMLLDEHIEGILNCVKEYNVIKNNNKNEKETSY